MSEELAGDTLRRLQAVELEVLEAIDAACRSLGIAYFVDSGTALGARRHKGFIPWDDDIDVGMLRGDFERFLREGPAALAAGYSIHTFEDTPGFAGMFAKVYRDGTAFETRETREAGCAQGIFVDVFPYDALSSDARERARQLSRARFWQRVSYLYHAKSVTVPFAGAAGAVARAACRVAHVVVRGLWTREGIKRRFDAARRFRAEPSEDCVAFAYPDYGPYPRDVLVPPAKCSFEGRSLPCPHRIDRYLDIAYGPDWSKLPPESERRTHAPLRIDFGGLGSEPHT